MDALQILEEAKACSAQPDTVCYNIVLSIFRDFRWWAQALVTLGHMEQAGPQASVVSYSTVVSACESSTCWQVAVSLLQKTWDRGLAADIILLCAAASACGKALRWDLALHLSNLSMAESMGETGVAQNALPAVNAAMSAFGGLWEKAVELFAGLQCSGMRPDTVSYGAAMQNCDCASQWVQAGGLCSSCCDLCGMQRCTRRGDLPLRDRARVSEQACTTTEGARCGRERKQGGGRGREGEAGWGARG